MIIHSRDLEARSMTARFSWSQRRTRGHRPRLQKERPPLARVYFGRRPPISDLFQVLSQPPQNLFTPGIRHRALQFFESEMYHIVMMNLFGSDLAAELQPDAVEKIDLLRRKMRRVRP